MIVSKILQRLSLLTLAGLLAGCAAQPMPDPGQFFVQTPESAKHRALQTRMFEAPDEKELLSASAAVLQDLGFQLEESVPDVGVLRAAKERSAREYGQEINRAFMFLLFFLAREVYLLPVDLHQQINATLVTRRSQTNPELFSVRISFYRTIWKGDGQSGNQYLTPGGHRMEMIYDGRIYQQFFAKLSKSVFLEAHKI